MERIFTALVTAGRRAFRPTGSAGRRRALAAFVVLGVLLGVVPPSAQAGISADVKVSDIVVIDSRERDGTPSASTLKAGVRYLVYITGTYTFGSDGTRADAECSQAPDDGTFRRDRYRTRSDDLLDVYINNIDVSWEPETSDPHGCDPNHVYSFGVKTIRDATIRFKVRDSNNRDNQGFLTVAIFQTDCVSLVLCLQNPEPPTIPPLPGLPPIPGVPNVPTPPLPGVPQVPGVPVPGLPPLPGVPTLPGVPQPGDPGPLPSLPQPPSCNPIASCVPTINGPTGAVASSQLVEQLAIDVANPGGVTMRQPVRAGRLYTFVVSGAYRYDRVGNLADAECSQGTGDLAFRPDRMGPAMLDLSPNSALVDWRPSNPTEAFCADDHTYTFTARATHNGPINFRIIDSDHTDNQGTIQVSVLNASPAFLPNAGVQVPGELIDAVTIDGRDPFGSFTSVPLVQGGRYVLVASGAWHWGAGLADAECANTLTTGAFPDPAFRDDRMGPGMFDLTVGMELVRWTPVTTGNGPCDDHTTYRLDLSSGFGGHVLLRVREDRSEWYDDNYGAIQVLVYRVG